MEHTSGTTGGSPGTAGHRARTFDVARVRGLYPTVGMGTAYVDGPLSALQPESVIRAIIGTLRSSPTQPGAGSARSQQSARTVEAARRAFADLVGSGPESVVFGSNLAAAMLQFTDVIAADWQLGDEVVLSRLDADSVVLPWQRAQRTRGAVLRWAEVDLESGELPAWQYESLIGPRTRIVTVPLANPATGTMPDVAAIAALAHAHDALVLVDAGGAATSRPLDLATLGADLVAVSAATFGGPNVTALVARPGLLLELDSRPRTPAPHHFETGPLPVELLDGATAAIDHLAQLDEDATGTRRERLATSIAASGAYTAGLWRRLQDGVASMSHVTMLGAGNDGDRAPLAAFAVAGLRPGRVGEALTARRVSVWTGPSDLTQLIGAYGLDELGGAVFAGVMPHTTAGEIDQLLDALSGLRPRP